MCATCGCGSALEAPSAGRQPVLTPVTPTALAERKPEIGVIPVIQEEIDNFEREVQAFRDGAYDQNPNVFRAFRLQHGTYGQRQPNVQMVRVKVPFGGLTSPNLRALGVLASDYAPLRLGHLTTRQNFQFHFIPLEDTPAIMRLLGESGISTREACGNTVRNVTADELAGAAADEVFDITPYAAAFARWFVRREANQLMPRKFKAAFSSSEADRGLTPMHDLGLIARSEGGRRGFKMVVGGGLSTVPKEAPTLYEFVPAADFLKVSEAITRVFNRDGERKNRNKARIKFLVAKIGIEEFRRRVEEEMGGEWARAHDGLDPLWLGEVPDEAAAAPPLDQAPAAANESAAYLAWRRTNVVPQAQPGYVAAYITVPLGDVQAPQFAPLADIAERFSGGFLRTTAHQNLVLRFVPENQLPALYAALEEIGLGGDGVRTLTDVVACPATDSCSLAIASSRGLAQELTRTLADISHADPEIERLHINISGCPNSCGQHQIGSIGFHGASVHSDGRQVPAAEVFLGGGIFPGVGRMGVRVGKVVVKRAPEYTKALLTNYLAEREVGERWEAFVDRKGQAYFKAFTAPFQEVPPVKEDIESYMDWGQTRLFEVERGEGECAGV